MLSDFGISCLLAGSVTLEGTANPKGSARWTAVELIEPDPDDILGTRTFHTKSSDVWAYGMVLYVRQPQPLS